MGDPKRENGPARPPRAPAKDVPSRPPPDFAADLLADLKQTEPDFEITEFVPPEPIPGMRALAPDEITVQDPVVIIAPDDASDESTLRIDLASPALPALPAASTLVDPPPPRPPMQLSSVQETDAMVEPEANARGIAGIPVEAKPRSMSPRPRASSPAVAPRLALPCNVLVIDDDRRAGAQTGARLMEAGCTCRAVTIEDAAAVLDHSVHAVLLEIPAAEARADAGRARIERLAPWKGPLILTSAAVIDPLPELAGATVTKPYFIEDLIVAIESARRKPPPLSRGASRSVEILDPVEAIAHHDLDANIVRAMLVRADGSVSRGRVRTMSYDGDVLVSMNQPPRRTTDVGVELTLPDGRRMEIGGKIAECSGTEMEIALKLGDQERAFLRYFLDQARDVTQPFVEQVRIRQVAPVAGTLVDESQLDRMWQEAQTKLDDDELQQRFIQSCLKAQKLEHAVKCYRQLKQERPGDERVARYLQQVGTILGFYAFKKEPQVKDEAKLPMAVKIVLGVFLAAALILWIIVVVMR